MNTFNKKLRACLILGFVAFNSAILIAEEVVEETDDETANASEDYNRSGGYFKLGFGYRFETTPYHEEKNELSVFLDGRYQWENGLFIEAPGVSNKLNPGFSYGYNFYNSKHWSYDLIGNQSHGQIEFGANDGAESLYLKRDGSFRGGLRATGNYDQNTIQFTITPFSFNDDTNDGIYAALWLAKQWQIKNWNVHASLGFQYRSAEILDYYYGIPEEFAIAEVPAYKPKAGFNTSIQLGADYPIAQNWVFESYVRYTDLADSINDSPILKLAVQFDNSRSENITEAGFFINYVF